MPFLIYCSGKLQLASFEKGHIHEQINELPGALNGSRGNRIYMQKFMNWLSKIADAIYEYIIQIMSRFLAGKYYHKCVEVMSLEFESQMCYISLLAKTLWRWLFYDLHLFCITLLNSFHFSFLTYLVTTRDSSANWRTFHWLFMFMARHVIENTYTCWICENEMLELFRSQSLIEYFFRLCKSLGHYACLYTSVL